MPFHTYRGQPGTKRRQQSGTWSQASTRHYQTSHDQHGREIGWNADNKSGMPTGLLEFRFDAPWYPDQEFVLINPDNPTQAYIDYPAMFAARKAALQSFHLEAVAWANQEDQPAPEFGKYNSKIIAAKGKPPRALELIAAAYKEHPWILGTSKREDPRLKPFLEYTSSDISRELEEFDLSIDDYLAGEGAAIARAARDDDNELAPSFFETRRGDARSRAALEAELQHVNAGGMDVIDGDEDVEDDDVVVDDEPIGLSSPVDDDELMDLDDEHDAEARGGRKVNPRKADLETKRDARRPSQTAVARKRGQRRSAGEETAPEEPKASRGNRAWNPEAHQGKTLADGAKPFVRGDSLRERGGTPKKPAQQPAPKPAKKR